MLTVGLCEDDPAIRRIVTQSLGLTGHRVVVAHDGGEALRRFGAEVRLDVIVLDIGLPDADGRDVCRALRAAGQPAPVLFLTALAGIHDRLAGFGAGGDDYLPKPFDVKELVARLEALARRGRTTAASVGGLRLDPTSHALHCGDVEVLVSPTEFRILAAIIARPGEVVRRRAVVGAAWPDGAVVSENTLDSYIRRVRAKLEQLDAPVTLHTVRGVGYVLK